MLARKRADVRQRAFKLGQMMPAWADVTRVMRLGELFQVVTFEGTETAREGDWLVEDSRGGYYPKSASTFAAEMVEVEDGLFVQQSAPVECWAYLTDDAEAFPAWLRAAIDRGQLDHVDAGLIIHTSWGDQHATLGADIIVHRSDEDIYPCKKVVFEDTYVVVDEKE